MTQDRGRQWGRNVIFDSRRTRWIRIWLGLGLGVMGIWLVWPSIAPTPDQPSSWGLYLSLDYPEASDSALATQLFAEINVAVGKCDRPAAVTIVIRNLDRSSDLPRMRRTGVLLSLMGPRGEHGTVQPDGARQATTLSFSETTGGSVGYARKVLWNGLAPLKLTARLAPIGTDAGYDACYTSSPQLFAASAVDKEWNGAADAAGRFLERRSITGFDRSRLTAGVVNLTVANAAPDRGLIDANGIVVRRSVRVACSISPPEDPAEDPAFDQLLFATRPNCGSVQTFRAIGASGRLNSRSLFAGLALSTAIAMLLEAVFVGQTIPPRTS